MTKLLAFLSSIRLTLAQYAAMGGAALLGLLVVALKVQGSRLHKAQIQLLEVQVEQGLGDAASAVIAAKRAYRLARRGL